MAGRLTVQRKEIIASLMFHSTHINTIQVRQQWRWACILLTKWRLGWQCRERRSLLLFQRMSGKREGDSSHRCSWRAASAWGVSWSRRSVEQERRLSRERVYREGEDDREEENTAQAFCKKYHNFFIFQAIFFIHTSTNFHRSNLFKNVWITRIDCVLFVLRLKNQAPRLLKWTLGQIIANISEFCVHNTCSGSNIHVNSCFTSALIFSWYPPFLQQTTHTRLFLKWSSCDKGPLNQDTFKKQPL